jgi:hypothetical protein
MTSMNEISMTQLYCNVHVTKSGFQVFKEKILKLKDFV